MTTTSPPSRFSTTTIATSVFVAIACSAALALSGCQSPHRAPFRFLAIGDTPYDNVQDQKFRALLEQSATESFDFLLHVGDIKGQNEPCTNERFEAIRDLFRQQPTPVVYTPGDNEWTDCHGAPAGSFDPVERLDTLRRMFFEDKTVLRLAALNVRQQSETVAFSRYVENYRFHRGGVLFIVVHIPGSGNGRRQDHPASMKEYEERSRANHVFLEESLGLAKSTDVAGVAIIIHANPHFEGRQVVGFHGFLNTLEGFLRAYRKPVVCIHGDTHIYRVDQPFADSQSGQTFPHFTRMEVFGSPIVAGVVVNVDPTSPTVFSFAPYELQVALSSR